jgi:NADPH-dependent 2,4-dienoyl-CoA reductase/sulfur reductase-like enzyme
MQTEVEGVWAAGDCAEAFRLVRRRPVNIALGIIANKQGRMCGIDVGGGYATFPGVVGRAVSKICALEVACTEMNEREAAEMGLQYAVGKLESTTRAGYFPGAGKITVKVLAERGSGRFGEARVRRADGQLRRRASDW